MHSCGSQDEPATRDPANIPHRGRRLPFAKRWSLMHLRRGRNLLSTRHAPRCRFAPELLDRRVLLAATLNIEGVQNDSLDQSRVHASRAGSQNGEPLSTSGEGIDLRGFLDTSASGLLISTE